MSDPRARRFMYLLGWVSLFADLTHEGMRSILGPFLTSLGATATAVGVVAGTGEAVGYVLRYVTGSVADRTRRYWALAIAGYACNLIAVPLLAVAGTWPMVAALVGIERLGKAMRSPAKSVLTSFVAPEVGPGKTFAIVDAMDQAGALAGPLLVAGVLAWRGDTAAGFAWAFALLGLPALATLGLLFRARHLYPDPRKLEPDAAPAGSSLSPRYAIYLAGAALVAIGLADWPLLAFHLQGSGALSAAWLPVVYAAAMGADGLASLAAGLLFDRARGKGGTGAGVIAAFVALGAAYAPLVFAAGAGTSPVIAITGIALWAIARAATESIGKALIAAIVPAGARGRAYGLYYLVWGVAWWAGSVALGALYDHARGWASPFAVGSLLLGALVIAMSARKRVSAHS